MKKLFAGIDGGGTVTKVVVSDEKGKILLAFKTGSINHYGVGFEKTTAVYVEIKNRLIKHFGHLPQFLFFGNSALDNLANDDTVRRLTGGIFKSSKTVMHSDVYVALLGFTLGRTGAMLISGTGSMACGLDIENNYHTVGGWGHILGDEGSAYHLALKGIKAAIRAHDGLTNPTALTFSVCSFFKIKKLNELIDLVYNLDTDKSIIASFAVEIEGLAVAGDKLALELLEKEAEWLYRLAMNITQRCNTQNLGYYGSMLTKSNLIRLSLERLLKKEEISILTPRLSPELGALTGALDTAGIKLTEELIDNLLM
jgi:glucosamine kinase